MRDVNKNLIPAGSMVRLRSPDSGYNIGASNPAVGTKHECQGRYTGNGFVKWENGASNTYKNFELELVDNSFISIWD